MVETGLKKLEFRLLGSFTVMLDGTPVPVEHWKSRKVRGLVKLLALAPGHRLQRDQLIEMLWPDANTMRPWPHLDSAWSKQYSSGPGKKARR